MSPRRRRALAIATIVTAALAALAIRVVVEGRRALADGDAAYVRGDAPEAIAAWEAAARWYLPLAPHVDDAYDRLAQLARADHQHALPAWRAIRSASRATRGLWTPHAAHQREANDRIADLASRDPEGAPAAGPDAAARRAFHATRLARDPLPRRWQVALAVLSVGCWLAGVLIILRRGFDRGGAVHRRAVIFGVALAAVGALGWALGLYNA